MKFKKRELQDLVCEQETDNLKIITDEIVGHDRWSVHHDIIFQDLSSGKYYDSGYSIGATEYQDERPYQYDDDEIECNEVVPKTVTTIIYERI